MKLYAGIDLHSNNSYLAISDEEDKRHYKKRLPNQADVIRKAEAGALSAAPQNPEVASIADLSNVEVLLVEDNPFNQELALVVLEEKGLKVSVAENGLEALRLLCRQRFDVVLMDVQMPIIDGSMATRLIRQCETGAELSQGEHYELLQELQGAVKGTKTPIIAMTANAMAGDHERCLETGMDDYLTKPFHQEQIFAVLGRVITASRIMKKRS